MKSTRLVVDQRKRKEALYPVKMYGAPLFSPYLYPSLYLPKAIKLKTEANMK